MSKRIDNPMGTDGFEFVEYTAPDPAALGALFEGMGFSAVARHRSKRVTLYRQGDVNFIVNAEPESFAQAFARVHGPSICAIAFRVRDAGAAHARALDLGAQTHSGPVGPMELNIPAIKGIGGSAIYLVDRYGEQSIYDVDFVPLEGVEQRPDGVGLSVVDHLTHNVHRGRMDEWAQFYERVFSFREIRFFDIVGRHTGLKSRAMTSPCGKIRIPINESTDERSQIEEYLRAYRGEGIQHIALAAKDILSAVATLAEQDVGFMDVPDAYYETLDDRVAGHGEDVAALRRLQILLDGAPQAGQGLLLQIFTDTVIGPIFFELIQRKGNEGFGEGNFQALFEAIERDQIARGVLREDRGRTTNGRMRRWISFPRTEGVASRQAHADLPPGTYEHEIGREGFSGPATHIYHVHPPTDWSDWEGPLRPRAFDLMKLDALASSPWSATTVMENTHLRLRLWRLESSMDHLVRNGDGDDLLVVHEGEGDLFCDFGHLAFRDGDYIVLPRGVNWRMETAEGATLLLIEATNDSYRLPERGLVGEHAIFDPAILDTPVLDSAFRIQQSEDEVWRVVIERRGALSSVTYPFNPLDAVGWKGNALPVRLNWREIRPLMSHRYHLPSSAHTTFVAERFLISTFVPRPIESDPGALKVPFFHSNDDYDEVIFYHRGAFSSRDNIAPGMLTLHPAGALHGPHPKAFASGARRGRGETDEVAVMIDARDPLDVSEAASAVEWAGYVDSWRRQGPRRGKKAAKKR